ncbi:hypothetical protein RISK_004463 [Rhodopirellula islandica]|uniref:Uncharacterized protein n=1 Tax=Rhodopirellula islandica TaxID=595434 RepID=A0A0J1BAP8_RHOIS|nr:hypothetical protein [Rhodopirellula islandica]KLU03566.1 hypothetical protein RISK_004463 [Rhodopirellula islandica]
MNDSTLDPPGSIVVIGTTELGIEAALYGRFLGYDVTLVGGADAWADRPNAGEPAQRIGPTFRGDWFGRHWLDGRELAECWDLPSPMLPDRSLSPLAFNAIAAQRGDEIPAALPVTIGEWIQDGLLAVTRSDLLRGRVWPNVMVTAVETVDVVVEPDEEADADDESEVSIPPDYRLQYQNLAGADDNAPESQQCECVIVAGLPEEARGFAKPDSDEYWFELAGAETSDAEEMLREGQRQIAAIYAQLMGREELDLYRPLRG